MSAKPTPENTKIGDPVRVSRLGTELIGHVVDIEPERVRLLLVRYHETLWVQWPELLRHVPSHRLPSDPRPGGRVLR